MSQLRVLGSLFVLVAAVAAPALGQAPPAGDYQVTFSTVATSCQEGDTSYTADGSFTVTVGSETGGCADPAATAYNIFASPVANSSPLGNTPPNTAIVGYIGFGSGDFFFGNAGAGQYSVSVEEISSVCTPATDPKNVTVTISQAALTCDPVVSATKTASGDAFAPGMTVGYTVVIQNDGGGAATGVTYSDTPDPNTSLVVGSVTTSQGTVTSGNTAGDTTVAVDVGDIAGLSSVTITYDVTIDPDTASGTFVSNQGLASSTNHPDVVTDDPTTPVDDDETVVSVQSTPPGIPTIGNWGAGLLILLLAGLGTALINRLRLG
jgi:uncharacterized repeat protein (TIGR01451 family)